MSRRRSFTITLASFFAIVTSASAVDCDGSALLKNNTPLKDLCQSFGDPNRSLPIPLAMAKERNNVAMITASANDQGVPAQLALAVAHHESAFSSCAGSPTGVKGPMQLTQRTGNSLGYNRDINEQNIKGGMAVLKQAVGRCGTSDFACLSKHYNGASPGEQAQWAKGVEQSGQKIQNMQSSEFPTDCEVCEPAGSSGAPGTGNDQSGQNGQGGNGTENPANPNGNNAGNYEKYVGQTLGKDAECASLTKALTPGLGPASTWKPGELVQGNTSLKPGTAIATFNYNGNYGSAAQPGGASGYSHTGIYLSQNLSGIQILHQYASSGGSRVDTIPWASWGKTGAEGGSRYYTVR